METTSLEVLFAAAVIVVAGLIYFAGPHLLAILGLPQLQGGRQIREAIEGIRQRTGHDPWEGAGEFWKR